MNLKIYEHEKVGCLPFNFLLITGIVKLYKVFHADLLRPENPTES